MYGLDHMADATRAARAIVSNQLARHAPGLYVRVTAQTGRGGEDETPQDIADYFTSCFYEYFEVLGVPVQGITQWLRDKNLLEYGPGDIPGAAILMIAHGARSVVCVDRFPLMAMSSKNVEVVRCLLARLRPEQRERALGCFHSPEDLSAGFNPSMLRYLVTRNGLCGAAGTFDLVFSRAVLEHVNDLPATFRDMHNALRPGGTAVHQVDLKSHGLHRSNPLDFLTWPPRLWHWMYSHKGVPNRWRVDRYRDIVAGMGFQQVRLEPTDFAADAVLAEVRPHLAEPFRQVSDQDLGWLGFWLVCVKEQA